MTPGLVKGTPVNFIKIKLKELSARFLGVRFLDVCLYKKNIILNQKKIFLEKWFEVIIQLSWSLGGKSLITASCL